MPDQAQSLKEIIQKTSIVLGYEGLDYGTTSADAMQYNTSGRLTSKDLQSFADLKKDLRATHFNFGDEKVNFETSSKLPDPTGEMHKYTAKLNVHAKGMLRKTSAVLGYDQAPYATSTGSATQWDQQQMIESIRLREQTKKISGKCSWPRIVCLAYVE